MPYIYNLYSSEQMGFSQSYHIQSDLPPHRFRAIMMEFRRGRNGSAEAFVQFMKEQFPDHLSLFEYDDVVQWEADQENSVILANLLEQNGVTLDDLTSSQ
ncbi:hypothetical protein R4Z10_07035 [Niallia sp. XMNu-256]|uniref:hypothetical protein n=1 Tax=Niallia sp. XMNu-256 TaxID=3082444 RepID=UPI0030D11E1D